MESVFRDLIEFEKACGNELPTCGPSVPSIKVAELRFKLIEEEAEETLDAINLAADALYEKQPVTDEMLAEVADGIADLIYVALGTAVAFGIDIVDVWNRVHAANMAKFSDGHYYNGVGKLCKPPSWQPPDVVGVIANQRPLSEIYSEST